MLLKNFYTDFLLEKIGTFIKLRANEDYMHVRVVLTGVDLYWAMSNHSSVNNTSANRRQN